MLGYLALTLIVNKLPVRVLQVCDGRDFQYKYLYEAQNFD